MTDPVDDTKVTPPATPPADPPTPPATPPTPPATPPEDKIDDTANPDVDKVDDDKVDDLKTDDLDMLDPKNVGKVVDQRVEQRLGKIRETMAETRIAAELNNELATHPEYKPYEKRIRNWVNHPNRKFFIAKGFPVKSVILEAIAPYLERIGAEKLKVATDKAKKTTTDGQTTVPPATTKRDVSKMSNKEVDQLAQDVISGRVKTL